MVKRKGKFLEKLCNPNNINIADINARKNKISSIKYIQEHDKNRGLQNNKLIESFKNLTYKTSKYQIFKIFEPKERLIFRLPYFPDRIAHHSIMNVVKQFWTNRFIKTSYSCIEGRGIHACMKDVNKVLKQDINGTKYCLKLDIRKFYPSIMH